MAYRSVTLSLVSLLLLLPACGPDVESGEELGPIPRGLVLDEPTAGTVVGSFGDDEHALRFRSEVGAAGYSVEVQVNGMTLVAQVDGENVHYDGYASDNGEPTQMTDEDRAALEALAQALDELGEVEPAVARLRSFADQWAEFPSTLETSGTVYTGFRSYSSLCWAKNTYQTATHDCWSYNNYADGSTYSAYVGMQPAANGCAEGTYYWVNNAWACLGSEPNHSTTIEHAYGACFGRCGGGCGSESQLTVDCLNHDSCVRFGHDLASLWCDDEFTSTIDDWASAPNCGI
jgi:hypothetical protein